MFVYDKGKCAIYLLRNRVINRLSESRYFEAGSVVLCEDLSVNVCFVALLVGLQFEPQCEEIFKLISKSKELQ